MAACTTGLASTDCSKSSAGCCGSRGTGRGGAVGHPALALPGVQRNALSMAARKRASCPVILARAADRLTAERKLQAVVRTEPRARAITALRLAVDLAHAGKCGPAQKALTAARRALSKKRRK